MRVSSCVAHVEICRLKAYVLALEDQVVSLGGTLDPLRRQSAPLGITTSPRGSVSLEVPPLMDRRDSSASWLSTSSDTSASSRRASSDELFPPVWSSSSRSSLPLVKDEDEGVVPDLVLAELSAISLAERDDYAFPRPPTLPPLALPALPSFPVLSAPASSSSPATQAGMWPPRRGSTLDPLSSLVEWRVSAPPCASAGPLSSPILLGGCISPVLSLRTDA
ncbi:hypothetical protein JCM8208_005509 [Rhodotorula glutinis]